MPCESCNVQFSVFKKKRPCAECRRLYCNQCLVRRNDKNLCKRCVVLTTRPLSKVELQKLKPKDLIFYLQSKHISTAGCVEKEELVDLVIAHATANNSPTDNMHSPPGGNKRTSDESENCSNPFNQIKQTCQNLFNSFTEKISSDLGFELRNSAAGSNASHNISTQPQRMCREIPTFSSSINRTANERSQYTGIVPNSSSTIHVTNDIEFTQLRDNSSSNSPTSPSFSSSSSQSLSSKAKSNKTNKNKHKIEESDAKSPPKNLDVPFVHTMPKNKKRCDTTFSDNAASGCDCSDDELISKFQSRHESWSNNPQKSKKSSPVSQSDSAFEEQVPGPSGSVPDSIANSKSSNGNRKSSGDSSNSSFEELGAVGGGGGGGGGGTSGTSESERWQIVNKVELPAYSECSRASNEVLTNDSSFPSTSNSDEVTSDAFQEHSKSSQVVEDDGQSIQSNRRVLRSRSESSVIRKGSCQKCGKCKKNLKQYVTKFKKQLESAQMPEALIKEEVKAFLCFLEKRSAESFEDSDSGSDTETEECCISVDGQLPSSSQRNRETVSSHETGGADDDGIHIYAHGSDDNVVDPTRNGRFINLGGFTTSSELEDLSVKQLKEILMLHRVDYKGCCEKTELLERVYRLWKDLQTSPAVDKLPTDDLCKICMDAPIECVILECGHMATCTNCGKVLSECPICRQYIVRVVRFFRA